MPSFDITSEVEILSDARVKQVEGIFDVPPSERSVSSWHVDLPVEERDWQIGLIVGPSGAGKTTVARKAFGEHIVSGYDWDDRKAIVSQFPKEMSVKDVTACLSSVGFSSPPSWLRPFRALSNGEQFRVTLARALAEPSEIFAIDEFTSVVDRTVAQIGSHAVAKAIRRTSKKMVAISCHFDIIEWLQPDWIYEPVGNQFQWRSLRRRPDLHITVRRVSRAAWSIFKKHHYLSEDLHKAAQIWCAFYEGSPVCLVAMLHMPHPTRSCWRCSRIVVMPDYQGAGFALPTLEYVCSLYRGLGKNVTITTSHPAMMRSLAKSGTWKMSRKPGISRVHTAAKARKQIGVFGDNKRATASFEFCGAGNRVEAREFSLI